MYMTNERLYPVDFGSVISDAFSGEQDPVDLAATDYREFAKTVIKNEDNGDIIMLQDFQDTVIDALESDAEILLFVLPRGFGKSSLITIGYVAHLLGQNRNMRIIVGSNTEDAAISHLTGIETILRDEDYQAIFGDMTPNSREIKWTEKIKYVRRSRKMRHPSLLATGVGSAAVLGKRSDLIVVDDLIDVGHAESAAEREKAWIWFNGQLRNTRIPGARIIIVNTRFHFDDIAGRLKEMYKDADEHEFICIDIPALYKVYDDEGNYTEHSIWESRFPTKWLMKERERNYFQFMAHFMNDPIDTSKSRLQEHWLSYVDEAEITPQLISEMQIFAGVDPNTDKDSIKKDYFAVAFIGVHPASSRIYLLDLLYTRADLDTVRAAFRAKMEYWKPEKIVIETNAAQGLYQTLLNQDKEHLNYPFVSRFNILPKDQRILSMASHFLAGKISTLATKDIHGDMKAIPALEPIRREWITFPNNTDSHFDALDALEMAISSIIYYAEDAAFSVINPDEFLERMVEEQGTRALANLSESITIQLTKAEEDATLDRELNAMRTKNDEEVVTDEELIELQRVYQDSFKPKLIFGTIGRRFT